MMLWKEPKNAKKVNLTMANLNGNVSKLFAFCSGGTSELREQNKHELSLSNWDVNGEGVAAGLGVVIGK